MRYAIIFTWKDDNTDDSITADNIEQRNMYIKNMVHRYGNKFKDIYYCKIYSSGEYGRHIKVGEKGCNLDSRF